MSRTQKVTLADKEVARRKILIRTIKKQKTAGKIDVKGTFELIYLSFIPLLEHRGPVEDDLKELKTMLSSCADRMTEIIEKSKGKTAR
jgi:hypothetical protein